MATGGESGEGPRRRAAENWSRPDGIRGGAVTGPWRSVRRETAAPEAEPPALTEPELPRPAASGVRSAVLLGLALAMTFVALALALRPGG